MLAGLGLACGGLVTHQVGGKMRSLKFCRIVFAILLLSAAPLFGQATAPAAKQANEYQILIQAQEKPDGAGQNVDWSHIYQLGQQPPGGGMRSVEDISVRLDEAKTTLALLMSSDDLKQVLDYEYTKFATDLKGELDHRRGVISNCIKQLRQQAGATK
jgi:hypothetical protein